MSFLNLDDLPLLSLGGSTLNTEEKSTLSSSLVVLKDAENFNTVALWGKILGLGKDYLVAQALTSGDLFKRKWFYRKDDSLDCISWLQLPEVTKEEQELAARIHSRFQGDPAFEYSISLGEEEKTLSEEKRLSCVVRQIETEAAVIPRGSYYKDATGTLGVNPNFNGLNANEVGQLDYYLHFRPGFEVTPESVAARDGHFEESIDIFESIARDEPKGVWSLKRERQGSVALLRSLLWPGYVFFHAPSGNGLQHPQYNASNAAMAPLNTSNVGGLGGAGKFGAWYCGTGQKNINIGYML